ncbi:hypothetical protein ABIF24_004277 [Bradyrhizobium elkanii]|uniref:hypothetical protein n=1 Tax=Bradyrhizobium elkanii TaxID=29448 RepID=UPI0035146868
MAISRCVAPPTSTIFSFIIVSRRNQLIAHSALTIKTEGKGGPSSDNADQAKSAVGTELGDSFRFQSFADNTSSDVYDLQQLSHGNGKAYGDGQHSVAREGPEPVQDADGIDVADAHHDHSWHANLHAAHDLIV